MEVRQAVESGMVALKVYGDLRGMVSTSCGNGSREVFVPQKGGGKKEASSLLFDRINNTISKLIN